MAFVDVKPLLRQLGNDLTERLVLVGGQAVNFWEEFLLGDDSSHEPLTSKDIDFAGSTRDVRLCAARLGGKAHLPDPDHHTPSVGIVSYVDSDGRRREIDFIDAPLGVDERALRRTALAFDVLDEKGVSTEARFRVMHPVLCMESRVHNTMTLPGYNTPHGRRQLGASIRSAQEFLRRVLLPVDVRAVLAWNERIFRFCLKDHNGRKIALMHPGLDPFKAILVAAELPERFRAVRYPQMSERLDAYRTRQRALRKRS